MPGTVLIIDDAKPLAENLAYLLKGADYRPILAHTAAQAKLRIAETWPDVVLIDLQLPDATGAELMVDLKKSHPDVPFIIITAHGSIRSAVETTQSGAVDYLTKPFEPEQMFHAIDRALRGRRLDDEVRRLRSVAAPVALCPSSDAGQVRSRSGAMQRTLALAERASRGDGIVLLLGESGTGKDHLCRWIHRHSRRSEGPFFAINCAALSRELAESELFGHEPGAFTGTRGRKRGLLELAENGSILLDEVGELDLALQSKLLTFLDTRSFVRVGGEKSISIDARIFAATNRDLEAEVERGAFRKDLFYRLNVFPIRIPPLRERSEDVPALVEELLEQLACEVAGGHRTQVDPDALLALQRYDWPGNIRELRNILERALIVASGGRIRVSDLSLSRGSREWSLQVPFPNGQSLHDVTRTVAREVVLEALRRGKTRQEAAALLGISRHALTHQLKVLGIE